jgi:hypothetical protein
MYADLIKRNNIVIITFSVINEYDFVPDQMKNINNGIDIAHQKNLQNTTFNYYFRCSSNNELFDFVFSINDL